MRKLIFLIGLIAAQGCMAQVLTKKWTLEGLQAPESVVFHKGFFYVSNVSGQPADKDADGFISKISAEGEMVTLKWAEGLNAPKGLGVFKGKLYVADIDVVVVFELATGAKLQTFVAEGATFLNDVEISSSGKVYVSDTFGGNKIYVIENDRISVLIEDKKLDYPNGLKLKKGHLYVASWGVVTDPSTFGTEVPGKVMKINLKTNEISDVTNSYGNLDGLILYKDGFLTTDWIDGNVSLVDGNGDTRHLLDLKGGSADMYLLKKENLLLIPQMLDGTLTAYELE